MWKLYDENWSEIKLKPAGDNVAIDNKQKEGGGGDSNQGQDERTKRMNGNSD